MGRRVDVPIGMTALERSQLPSWSLWIVSGERARRSNEEMESTVGAAKTEGAKARANAKTFVQSIVAMRSVIDRMRRELVVDMP